MPTDCREVRPRNFPPRFSSGASRRFFSTLCLLATQAVPTAAHDQPLRPAEITVATGRATAGIVSGAIPRKALADRDEPPRLDPSEVTLKVSTPEASIAYSPGSAAPVRLPPITVPRRDGSDQGSQAVILAAYEEETTMEVRGESPLMEDVPSPEPAADHRAANNFGLKPMSAMSIDIAPSQGEGGHPEDFAAARFDQEQTINPAQNIGRQWALTDYRWEASMLCHGPLLFEQVNAERYGITYGCLQPMISGAHFFATVPALPYKVWANGHDQRQYALGYYRPGSYARPQCYKPRISADASLFEAGVILGLIYVLP